MTDTPVRDAATVVLVRDGSDGIETWLLTRVQQMVFAGGMSVFPGGRVDVADETLPLDDAAVDALAARFAGDAAAARAVAGAAARELFEETGVLLSVPGGVDLRAARADVEAGRRGFGDLLGEYGLSLDAAALHPWGRWVTPAGEVRRYDARFFVAELPAGAEPRDVTTESSSAGWFAVGAAIEQAQRGELGMLPPTVVTLGALAEYASVRDVIAAAPSRPLDPVSPDVERRADGTFRAHLPDGRSFELPKALFR